MKPKFSELQKEALNELRAHRDADDKSPLPYQYWQSVFESIDEFLEPFPDFDGDETDFQGEIFSLYKAAEDTPVAGQFAQAFHLEIATFGVTVSGMVDKMRTDVIRTCVVCDGTGTAKFRDSNENNDWEVPCPACRATGTREVF